MIRSLNQQAMAVAMAAFSGFIVGVGSYIIVKFAYVWVLS